LSANVAQVLVLFGADNGNVGEFLGMWAAARG
jgi:hypothetical protein